LTAAIETTGAGQGRIDAAIRQASARSGVDFAYLYNQARLESGFNPDARARTSSATGLYQFLDQTWLAMIDRHGAANNLGWAANAVRRGGDGRYHVADPAVRRQIMDLRRNPEAAAAMAAGYATDNRAHLERRLGRSVDGTDLYMAHFLGAGGATRFLRAAAADPDAAAAAQFPREARANRAIFYHRSGAPRSFSEIRNMMAARLNLRGDVQMAAARPQPRAQLQPGGTDTARQLAALQSETANGFASVGPHHARLAYLLLADLEGMA
jgi:hypothetical protein